MSRRVYLAGRIESVDEATSRDWRRDAARIMREYFDLVPVDPMEGEPEQLSDSEIVNRDRYLLSRCDAVLVDGRGPGWGTSAEVFDAWQQGIPVIAWGTNRYGAPTWLRAHTTYIHPVVTEAIGFIADLLL
jgi:nucleoside 2-deoxyribosyltransferase